MDKRMPIVVSHYTKDTGYAKEVLNLIASLEKWKLRYDIEVIESLGTWRANSNYCARVVQKTLARYPNEDILCVDADAVFRRYPDLFLQDDFTADVAAHVHDFRWHERELMGGTLFFCNKPEVRWLVDTWVLEAMVNRPNERNGDLLQELIESDKFHVNFQELPAQYCKIFDLMEKTHNPVIEHFQASRRFRQQINSKGLK